MKRTANEIRESFGRFKEYCSMYEFAVKLKKNLENEHPDIFSGVLLTEQTDTFTALRLEKEREEFVFQHSRCIEIISSVEERMNRIEQICGHDARDIIWKCFVEDRKYREVAGELGIDIRQLTRKLERWFRLSQ